MTRRRQISDALVALGMNLILYPTELGIKLADRIGMWFIPVSILLVFIAVLPAMPFTFLFFVLAIILDKSQFSSTE